MFVKYRFFLTRSINQQENYNIFVILQKLLGELHFYNLIKNKKRSKKKKITSIIKCFLYCNYPTLFE